MVLTREQFEQLHGKERKDYKETAYLKAKTEFFDELRDLDMYYCHCCGVGSALHIHHIFTKAQGIDWWYFQKENFYPVGYCCHPCKIHDQGIKFPDIERRLKIIKQKQREWEKLQ